MRLFVPIRVVSAPRTRVSNVVADRVFFSIGKWIFIGFARNVVFSHVSCCQLACHCCLLPQRTTASSVRWQCAPKGGRRAGAVEHRSPKGNCEFHCSWYSTFRARHRCVSKARPAVDQQSLQLFQPLRK